jgi:hypothetical protein
LLATGTFHIGFLSADLASSLAISDCWLYARSGI